MKKIVTIKKRTRSSFSPQNVRLLCLFALFLSCFTFQAQAQCDNTIVINQTGPGTFSWDAPATGGPFQVEIIATGGGGGDNLSNLGGGGASMSGIFIVQNGETLFAVAGGAGGSSSGTEGGGGGAGSGVARCSSPTTCATAEVLIIAAGGNGAENGDGLGGLATTGAGGGGAGGGSNGGGGGGGRNSSGGSGTGSGGSGGGVVFTNGLSAGGTGSSTPENDGAIGMGGGGGGGSDASSGSGGGGGHTGASGGNTAAAQSFNSGTSQVNSNGDNGGGAAAGSVIVTCLQSLPIKLINFKAVIKNGVVSLMWATATEKENIGFDVERSADNRNWSALGFVPGNGTTTQQHDYTFTDETPLAGINYYRLRQNDSDGKFEYSPMVIADVRGSELQFDIFPNPSTTGELSVRTLSQQEGNGLLEIYDWAGYKVYMETFRLLKGTMAYPVSMSTFPKGAYTARFEMPDGQVQFKKIVLH